MGKSSYQYNSDGEEELSVWMRFESDDDEPSHEANIYKGKNGKYRTECYHVNVGQVVAKDWPSHKTAAAFLEKGGYRDFTSWVSSEPLN